MWRRQSEIDALLARIRHLVRELEHWRNAGAGHQELARRSAEIDHLRMRLAGRVRRALREEAVRHGTQA
jgi:hypothetical protein